MLIANFISLAKSKFKPGVGSYCVREYKKCISEFDWNLCASSMYDCGDMENENYGRFNFTAPQKIQDFLKVEQSLSVFSSAQNRANENICLFTAHISSNICENLCFSSDFSYDPDEEHKFYATEESSELRYNHEKNAECKSICMLASDLEVEEDCPFHNRCPNGCPCPGYKCLEDVLDFNLASVVFGKNDQKNISRSFYKISRKSETLKFDELAMNDELTNLGNFCVVTFRGHFFVIQAEPIFRILPIFERWVADPSLEEDNRAGYKLTLHKIDNNGNNEKLSEDFTKVRIIFGGSSSDTSNKICGRGIYQKNEERVIFCSTNESKGICHSYAFKENKVFLTEIYNRPGCTVNEPGESDGVFGLTFNDQLTTVKLINSHTAVEVTSFLGRETSGNHKWNPHQEVHLPKYFRDETFSNEDSERVEDSGLAPDCKNSR
ncbi:unnamed protein product [Oikopleura dioica]|uniref:Uncharacterized protein n=1 Tax=Oikopleura dioica TaxID=34765 RepID=E4XVG8_OIKDI|nr:unnamed protein product [Oikopleura dioica]